MNVLTGALGLLMASPRHKHLFLSDLEWALLPPLALRQFRLFAKDNRPVAFATWAFVSEEVEARLNAGHAKLKPAEWKSGERCWIVDVVTPFGGGDGILKTLRETVLGKEDVRVLPHASQSREQKAGAAGVRVDAMTSNTE